MKFRMIATGFVLGVAAAVLTTQAVSQDQGNLGGVASSQMPTPEQQQAMMEQWMQSIQPGPGHKMLESSIGRWDSLMRIWSAGPDAPPEEIKGEVERKWVLGGRFVLEEMKSEFAMPGQPPVPWLGMGLFGYDNFRNVYVGCWADTMGTQLLTMKGAASPDGKTFTYYGEMDEPMIGVIGRSVKYQTRIVDDNTAVFTIYDLHAGDNYKVVEVTYTRKK